MPRIARIGALKSAVVSINGSAGARLSSSRATTGKRGVDGDLLPIDGSLALSP